MTTNLLTADIINACFEFLGGMFVMNNCRQLYKDKKVHGVSKLSVLYFTLWGWFNACYIYPAANLWLSFYGGLFILVANTIWICQMVYYSKYYKGNKE